MNQYEITDNIFYEIIGIKFKNHNQRIQYHLHVAKIAEKHNISLSCKDHGLSNYRRCVTILRNIQTSFNTDKFKLN